MSKLYLFAFDLPLVSVRGRWGIILAVLIASVGLNSCGGAPEANNPAAAQPVSGPAPISDTTLPSAPTSLTATPISAAQINLSWNAATDNAGVMQYRVERCQGSLCSNFAQIGTTPGTTTTFSDTTAGLVQNTTFRYRVRAADAAPNLGPYSNLVNVTTPGDVTPPVVSSGAPTGTLAAGTTQATMSVTSNESATCKWDTSSGTSYAAMPNTFTTTGGTFHSTQVTGLSNGQSYTHYVRCQDGAGNADTSSYTVSFSVGTGAGSITLSLVPSRTTGVAPLAVFFDAGGTTSPLTSRPFHELEYRWDFGDRDVNTGALNTSPPVTGVTTWATGSRAGDPLNLRNLATGPVAAHVYESAGTFTVTLTVTDGTNTDTITRTITVGNPDDVFAGNATVCFSNTTDFTGCPSLNQVTTSSWLTVRSSLASGRRLLLRRGHVWTASSTGSINVNGPWTIGAFGTGAKPIIRAAANGVTLLPEASGGGPYSDWRFMDLSLDPNGFSGVYAFRQIDGGVMPSQVTLLRLDTTSMVAQGIYTWAQSETFIGDCNITAFAYVVFHNTLSAGPNPRGAMLGNTFRTPFVVSDNSHVVRIINPKKYVISNNTLIGGQQGAHLLKMAGNPHVTSNEDATDIVISDNKFHEQGGISWPVTLAPVNDFTDTRTVNFIVERNWFVGSGQAFNYLYLGAQQGTVRNNIFDMSNVNPGAEAIGVRVIRRGVEPVPNDIHIYNNTFYSSASSGVNFIAIQVNAPATNTVVRNNFASAPNHANKTVLSNSGTGTIASNNTITNSPGWVSATPSLPAQFLPTGGSPAIGTGTAVPVWSDFARAAQPSPRDLGAVNH